MNNLKINQIQKLYFGYEDISDVLGIAVKSGCVAATRLVKQGALIRLKRNCYILRERWNTLEIEERFVLASVIQSPSYVSLMTALDYYQITTQVQRFFCESLVILRTKEVSVEGTIFNYTKISPKLYSGFTRIKDFFIAKPEKAFVDAVYLTALKRYSFDFTSVDQTKLDQSETRRWVEFLPKKTQRLIKDNGYIK